MTEAAPAIGARLGAGKEAEVFAWGAEALKLYRPQAAKAAAFREAAILAAVEAAGLPAPRVSAVGRFGDRWGLAMSRADGASFAAAMAADPRPYLGAMARLHRRIHRVAAPGLPDLKARLAANIGRTALAPARRRALLAGLAAMPDGDRLLHGDFHPWNILGPPRRPVVVDWLDAARGAPAADLCRSWLLMHPSMPELAHAYVAAYAALARFRPEEAFAWLPFVAAARLAEGVEAEAEALTRMAESDLRAVASGGEAR